MKTDYKISTLSDVYSRIIEKTADALKNYLILNKKKNLRFDVVKELKKRWKLRVDTLIDSMNGSWAKFQDSCGQKNDKYCLNVNKKVFSSGFCFPSICSLSWDLYKISKPKENKTSNFKLWVWNCMLSGIVNEGNLPRPSFILFKKNVHSIKLITRAKFLKFPEEKGKNVFISIKNMKNSDPSNNLREIKFLSLNYNGNSIKLAKNLLGSIEKDLSEEISGEDLESNIYEINDKSYPPNFLLAVIEKVYRRNTKWTIVLKDGVLNINKKDFLFNLCKCEFFW